MYLFEQRDLKFSQWCVEVSSLRYETVSLGVLLPGLLYFTLIMHYEGSERRTTAQCHISDFILHFFVLVDKYYEVNQLTNQ